MRLLLYFFAFSSLTLTVWGDGGLPTLDEVLVYLFNTTINNVVELANHFIFSNNTVKSENVQFYWYNSSGLLQKKLYANTVSPHDLAHPSASIIFLIHGFRSNAQGDMEQELMNAYHSKGFQQIYGVNWEYYANLNYLAASEATQDVGRIVGKFIMNLIGNNTAHLSRVHIIGHSLGAHVAGFAGKAVQNALNASVGRITGLDVAAPLFQFSPGAPPSHRLSSKDAEFVDVLHTTYGFGFWESIGKADYYLNYDGVQPGCENINLYEAETCSHSKAYELFTNSVKRYSALKATKCANQFYYKNQLCSGNRKIIVGQNMSWDTRGTYFGDTV